MHIQLDTFGTYLAVNNQMFLIMAKKQVRQTFSAQHVKSISISKGVKISSEAVLLAAKHQIPLIVQGFYNEPKGQFWSVAYGKRSSLRKKQALFSTSDQRIPWVATLVAQRIAGQIRNLQAISKRNRGVTFKTQIDQLHALQAKVQTGKHRLDLAALRGHEGGAAQIYFSQLGKWLPKDFVFEKRTRQPATDPFNALLNYILGIYYGKVENALLRFGLDPYIGLFHNQEEANQPSLVFDLIEVCREWAERMALELIWEGKITAKLFHQVAKKGKPNGLRLNEKGKEITVITFNTVYSADKKWALKARKSKKLLLDNEIKSLIQLIEKKIIL